MAFWRPAAPTHPTGSAQRSVPSERGMMSMPNWLDRKNPFLTQDHIAFRHQVRRFVDKEAGLERVRRWDRDREFPYSLFEKIAALGWRGLCLPEVYGGTPADLITACLVTEELSR